MFFTLFSNKKNDLVFEIDHSQAHKRFADDAHVKKKFNLHPDRAMPFARSIVIVEDSAVLHEHDDGVCPGRITHHEFGPNDSPPKIKTTFSKV